MSRKLIKSLYEIQPSIISCLLWLSILLPPLIAGSNLPFMVITEYILVNIFIIIYFLWPLVIRVAITDENFKLLLDSTSIMALINVVILFLSVSLKYLTRFDASLFFQDTLLGNICVAGMLFFYLRLLKSIQKVLDGAHDELDKVSRYNLSMTSFLFLPFFVHIIHRKSFEYRVKCWKINVNQ